MCGCDWNYVCMAHRLLTSDFELENVPDDRELRERERYEQHVQRPEDERA